jgi:hypothetical protein
VAPSPSQRNIERFSDLTQVRAKTLNATPSVAMATLVLMSLWLSMQAATAWGFEIVGMVISLIRVMG